MKWGALPFVLALMLAITVAVVTAQFRLRFAPAAVDPEPDPGSGDVVSTITVQDTGWVTMGIELAEGLSATGLKVGSYATQTDVLSTWGDGSIKMAAVTFNATDTGAEDVTDDTEAAGTQTPTWPTVVTTFTTPTNDTFLRSIGSTYTATLGSFSSSDCWYDGPLMMDCRKIVRATNGTPHGTLEVTYDIRSYLGGGHRVSVTLDNIYDDATHFAVAYNADVSINGSSVYTAEDLLHPAFSRGRVGTNGVNGKVFLVDGLNTGWASGDVTAMENAYAVPKYLSSVDADTFTELTDNPARFEVFQTGSVQPGFSAAGVRQDLSQFPDWEIQYLMHPNENRRTYMLAQAEAVPGVSLAAVRSHTDRTPIDILAVSFKWPNNLANGGADSSNAFAFVKPGAGNPGIYSATTPDTAHFGSFWYFAWITTADRFYADSLRFSSIWRITQGAVADRQQYPPDEMLSMHISCDQERALAHCLRESHAATWYPNQKESGYWSELFHEATATTLHMMDNPFNVAVGSGGYVPPVGLPVSSLFWNVHEGQDNWGVPPGSGAPEIGPNGEKMFGIVLWMTGKMLIAMDFAMQTGEYSTYGEAYRERNLDWFVGQWRDGGPSYWPKIAPYVMPVGFYTVLNNYATWQYYGTWPEMSAAFVRYVKNQHPELEDEPDANIGGNICVYGPHEYTVLVIATRVGVNGAAQALSDASGYSCGGLAGYPTLLDKVKNDAGFAWRVP